MCTCKFIHIFNLCMYMHQDTLEMGRRALCVWQVCFLYKEKERSVCVRVFWHVSFHMRMYERQWNWENSCVCMRVCLCVCAFARARARVRASLYVCSCVCIFALQCEKACVVVCVYTHTTTHVLYHSWQWVMSHMQLGRVTYVNALLGYCSPLAQHN